MVGPQTFKRFILSRAQLKLECSRGSGGYRRFCLDSSSSSLRHRRADQGLRLRPLPVSTGNLKPGHQGSRGAFVNTQKKGTVTQRQVVKVDGSKRFEVASRSSESGQPRFVNGDSSLLHQWDFGGSRTPNWWVLPYFWHCPLNFKSNLTFVCVRHRRYNSYNSSRFRHVQFFPWIDDTGKKYFSTIRTSSYYYCRSTT